MSIDGSYCETCRKFVTAILGHFIHPHHSRRSCLVCRKCGGMVYRREQEQEETA